MANTLLAGGFCGGLTTFSTFSLENLKYFKQGKTGHAVLYWCGSVVLCLACVYLGLALGKLFQIRIRWKNEKINRIIKSIIDNFYFDINKIEDYLQIKNEHGNTIALQSVLPAYPTRGYAQSGYFSAQDYSDGLYILWIEQVGTGTDKTVHGAIIHDGKPTATTLDEYLGTTPSPSPSASPSPSPSQSPDGTWADISKMKVELESGDVNNDLNISGISVIDGHEYYVYVTKNKKSQAVVAHAFNPSTGRQRQVDF